MPPALKMPPAPILMPPPTCNWPCKARSFLTFILPASIEPAVRLLVSMPDASKTSRPRAVTPLFETYTYFPDTKIAEGFEVVLLLLNKPTFFGLAGFAVSNIQILSGSVPISVTYKYLPARKIACGVVVVVLSTLTDVG